MAWETRRRGGQYYTRSVRVNGVVRRRYLGNDDLAHLLASLDEQDRHERTIEAQAWQEERAAALEREALLIEFDSALDALAAQTLTAAGYHRHKYGQWRKQRGTSEHSPHPDADQAAPDA